jgi:hypothetical protein
MSSTPLRDKIHKWDRRLRVLDQAASAVSQNVRVVETTGADDVDDAQLDANDVHAVAL